ncbi:hypothetical protein LEP1GSC061_1141 [Leptospira wolffii serovar Khorat str. Khorat-H2]|nr:hypothetical protein LEP1GSC061_1141 [Leptospira wolffii serovar Khorat str. Khorat-H2]
MILQISIGPKGEGNSADESVYSILNQSLLPEILYYNF